MNRRRGWGLFRKVALYFAVIIGGVLAFRQGLIPPQYSPLPAIVVERPFPLVVDWQLKELSTSRDLCRGLVSTKHVTGRQVADKSTGAGCGWTNAIQMSRVGGVRYPASRMNCSVAGALALWIENVVQPAALEMFQRRVIAMRQMGVYNCRNIIGARFWGNRRSQHATANAADVGGFTLEGGERISVRRHWNTRGQKARFLRRVHRGACQFFRVALSPEFNRAHHDHFHFDRGPFWRCK
ncbi:MAG: extensin family protein [Pseudomonadota bacterium]